MTTDVPRTARIAFLTTFGAAALAGAIAPLDRPGIGWLIASVAVVAAVRAPGPGVPVGERWSRRIAGVAAVLLVAVGAIRAAGWLVAGCVCVAVPLAAYAVAGGRRAAQVASGMSSVVTEIPRAGDWLRRGVPPGRWSVLRGGLIAVPMVGVFTWLLAAAEPRFDAWLRDSTPSGGRTGLAIVGFLLVAVITGVLAHVRANGQRPPVPPVIPVMPVPPVLPVSPVLPVVQVPPVGPAPAVVPVPPVGPAPAVVPVPPVGPAPAVVPVPPVGPAPAVGSAEPAAPVVGSGRTRPTAEWAIPVGLVDGLFAAYVLVDLPVLFGGDRYVLADGGPDYAPYAVTGFAALTVVTVLTLAVVAVVALVARRETVADRMLVRALVGPLCLLTLVIAASAVDRAGVYADAYGFTVSRLVGVTAELLFAALFVLVLIAGIRLRGAWLPRAVVAVSVATLFALVALNPEALVARTVIGRYHHDGHLDRAYLWGLSADAADEIDKLPEPSRSCVLRFILIDMRGDDSWYTYNLARENLLADVRARPLVSAGCDGP